MAFTLRITGLTLLKYLMLDHMFDDIKLEDYRSHITLIFHARTYV